MTAFRPEEPVFAVLDEPGDDTRSGSFHLSTSTRVVLPSDT